MKTPVKHSIVVFLLCMAAAGAARAESSAALDERHLAVGLSAGLGSAVGFGGPTLTYSPAPLFQLEAGMGFGPVGADLSLMPKLAFGTAQDRVVTGAGLSVTTGSRDAHPVLWFNFDMVGYEHRYASGLSLSASAGLTLALAGRGCFVDCGDPSFRDADAKGVWAPQGRVGVGYWF
jgi:hypothetical protein